MTIGAGAPGARETARTALPLAVLALLAYLPALASSPGRMPADTKLYLYLDPGGLLGRAASTFEPDQFAGWVPHQQITYLWPSGPWYWLLDALAVPDWIAHRLWIGTLFLAAGAGVLWAGRLLGLGARAALVAAMLYQLSPYVLPYVSRTSLMLLPWAGLGWILALTMRATTTSVPGGDVDGWRDRLTRWRDPALIALVVATVGSVNATALVMIVPAPVLWLAHAGWQGLATWRHVFATTLRTALLCTLASLWWLSMLVVQSRHGAPVLAFSETLADVSRNSTGSEVLRALGYWLFYVRDPIGPTTTASFDYLVSSSAIAISFLVTVVGLSGLTFTSWGQRRYAGTLVAVGAVLAVGVHPIEGSSPLMSLVADDDGSGLALALRSSTRALPVMVLGLALGAGALVAAIPDRPLLQRRPWTGARSAAAAVVAVVLVANVPSIWSADLVDPAIDRDEDVPDAWREAAARLDEGSGRVLQLPGAEFGAFRWGYTVDPPVPALTDRPLVTRDLLPLGSGPAMNLLYALDDRFQEGTIEPPSVAPVARLLAAHDLWLSNDSAFERFRTARPELVDDLLTSGEVPGLGETTRFGEPVVNVPDVPMLDATSITDARIGAPLAPVALVEVEQPLEVVRAKASEVLLAGDGDGVVDAAAAGLLSGHELLRYSASSSASSLDEALSSAGRLLVTDTNRDRAHHWRGSQDVHGHTEPGGPGDDVLVATSADQRLEVFPTDDPASQTIALQQGPVTALASAYGEPFAYLPEQRAVMAIDGDPTTAWRVGGHADPVDERIELRTAGVPSSLRLLQPTPAPGGRWIDLVRVTVDGHPPFEVGLDERSLAEPGQRVDLPPLPGAGGTVGIEILGIEPGDPAVAASRDAVGFAELDLGLGATEEIIRPPTDLDEHLAGRPWAMVLTRLRTDPTDRWRSDPEPELRRQVTLPGDAGSAALAATVRLDARASDEVLSGVLAPGRRVTLADRRLTGSLRHLGAAATDGDPTTAWVSPFDAAVGATLTVPLSAPLGPELELVQPPGPYSRITSLRLGEGTQTVEVTVPPPDATGRSVVELPRSFAGDEVVLTITEIDAATTRDRRFGDVSTLPVAVAELAATGIAAEPLDRDTTITLACDEPLLTVDGEPLAVTGTATAGDLLDGAPMSAGSCPDVGLPTGTVVAESVGRAGGGWTVDRLVIALDEATTPAEPSGLEVEVRDASTRRRTVTVPPCPTGCWLVLGEGFNDAWRARTPTDDLGSPELVDGGFNGWRMPASSEPTEVELTWSVQRPVTLGLAVSVVTVIFALTIVVLARRRRSAPLAAPRPVRPRHDLPSVPRLTVGTLAGALSTALLVDPVWALPALGWGVLAVGWRRWRPPWSTRWFELGGLVAAGYVAVAAVVIERREQPFPDAGWTIPFEGLNGVALTALVLLAVGTALGVDAGWQRRATPRRGLRRRAPRAVPPPGSGTAADRRTP